MLPRKFNIFKESKHLHINNFCLLAECDLVSNYTEGEKPLLFLLQNRQEFVYFHQISVCVTLCHEHSVVIKLFILFHKHPAHASPMPVPLVKEEGSPERLSVYSVWAPSGKPRQRTQFLYNGQRYLHSTVPSNHQIQKFLVLTLALLQASGNHWGLANNWKYYLTGYWSHLANMYIWSYPSFLVPFTPYCETGY